MIVALPSVVRRPRLCSASYSPGKLPTPIASGDEASGYEVVSRLDASARLSMFVFCFDPY